MPRGPGARSPSLLPRVPIWEGPLGRRGRSASTGPWGAASWRLQLAVLELLKATSLSRADSVRVPRHSCELPLRSGPPEPSASAGSMDSRRGRPGSAAPSGNAEKKVAACRGLSHPCCLSTLFLQSFVLSGVWSSSFPPKMRYKILASFYCFSSLR